MSGLTVSKDKDLTCTAVKVTPALLRKYFCVQEFRVCLDGVAYVLQQHLARTGMEVAGPVLPDPLNIGLCWGAPLFLLYTAGASVGAADCASDGASDGACGASGASGGDLVSLTEELFGAVVAALPPSREGAPDLFAQPNGEGAEVEEVVAPAPADSAPPTPRADDTEYSVSSEEDAPDDSALEEEESDIDSEPVLYETT